MTLRTKNNEVSVATLSLKDRAQILATVITITLTILGATVGGVLWIVNGQQDLERSFTELQRKLEVRITRIEARLSMPEVTP